MVRIVLNRIFFQRSLCPALIEVIVKQNKMSFADKMELVDNLPPIISALEKVQCIVNYLQFAVGELYKKGNSCGNAVPQQYAGANDFGSSFHNMQYNIHPIECSMSSLNQYLPKDLIQATESLLNIEQSKEKSNKITKHKTNTEIDADNTLTESEFSEYAIQ